MFQTDLGKRSIGKRYAVTSIMGLLLVFVYICVCRQACRCALERVCVAAHLGIPACVCVCVYSWWLCASRTAFIRININMCLSCSPSHPCPLGAECPRAAIIIPFWLSVNLAESKTGTLTSVPGSNSQANTAQTSGSVQDTGKWCASICVAVPYEVHTWYTQ